MKRALIIATLSCLPFAAQAAGPAEIVLIGFGATIKNILDTPWGMLVSSWHVIDAVWMSLFGLSPGTDLPPAGLSWVALAGGCLVFLWLLSRRIRAYEVVR